MTDTLARNDGAPPRPRRRPRWGWALAVILVAGLAFTVSGVFPFRQLLAQGTQVDHARAQYEALADENARLEAQIAALQTDQEIERIARDQYGLVRPGEIGYVVISPPARSPETTMEPMEAETGGRAWWERIWNFLTGSDVGDDG